MRETGVQSLGQEDPLEKEMATHSSILACRIPWTEEPGGLESTVAQRLSDFTFTFFLERTAGLTQRQPSVAPAITLQCEMHAMSAVKSVM